MTRQDRLHIEGRRGMPRRHAYGPLTTQKVTGAETRARVRRWAKRVEKRAAMEENWLIELWPDSGELFRVVRP